jgi:drug/metabolite transporter (DMT)-like permease
MTAMNWALVAAGVLMSAFGSIFLKLGARQISHDSGLLVAAGQAFTSALLGLGVILYVVPVLIWIYLLKRIDISFLQPLFSSVYVVTPILAIFLLGEAVPLGRWLGIAVVCAGVALIASH